MIFHLNRQQRLSGNKIQKMLKTRSQSSGFVFVELFGLNFGFGNNDLNLSISLSN